MTYRPSIMFLELFSGSGNVSVMAEQIFRCCTITIDRDDNFDASIIADIMDIPDTTLHAIKTKYPEVKWIIWASPPCTMYSDAKTNLNHSDRCDQVEDANRIVSKMWRYIDILQPVWWFIENPDGKKAYALSRQPVMKRAENSVQVDYCQYGADFKKSTRIWSSKDLTTRGFKPKLCQGLDQCDSMIYHLYEKGGKHISDVQCIPSAAKKAEVPLKLVTSILKRVVCDADAGLRGVRNADKEREIYRGVMNILQRFERDMKFEAPTIDKHRIDPSKETSEIYTISDTTVQTDNDRISDVDFEISSELKIVRPSGKVIRSTKRFKY